MKNPKFFLTTLFAAAAMSATANAAGEIISLNFTDSSTTISESTSGTAGFATYDNNGTATHVGGIGWTNVAGTERQTITEVRNYDGKTLSGVSVTAWNAAGTWGPSVSLPSTVDGVLQKKYWDVQNHSGGSQWHVDIETPYLVCDVYVYLSGDGGTYGGVLVNGTSYIGTADGSIEGSGSWGDRGNSASATLAYGKNALMVSGVSGTLSLANELSQSARASLSGIQVVNTYDGTAQSFALDGTAVDWTNSAIGATPWTNSTAAAGTYAAFKLEADTAVTVAESGITTDAITVAGDGALSLSGEAITLIGPGVIRTDSDTASLVIANNLVFENGGSVSGNVSGSGSVTVAGGVLTAGVSVLANFTGAVIVEEGGALNVGGLTTPKTDASSISGAGKIIFDATPSNHSAGIKLGDNFTGTVQVSGNANLPRDSELGGATKVILANTHIWTGETAVYDQDFEVVGQTSNAGGAGMNKQRGSGNLTFNGEFLFAGGASWALEQGTTTFKGNVGGDDTTEIQVRNTANFSGPSLTLGKLRQTGGAITIAGSGKVTQYVGTSDGGAAGTLDILESGSLVVTGDSNSTSGNQGSFQIAHWGATQTVNVAGTLSLVNAGISVKDGNADIHVSGEVNFGTGLTVADWGDNSDVVRLNLNDGSRMNVGAAGITASNVLTLKLDGDVAIGSLAESWTTTRDLAMGTSLTIDTQVGEFNAAGKVVAGDKGAHVTLAGQISGAGRLVKEGNGTLVLGSANTYTGGTEINGGMLVIHDAASLGTGDVTINGGGLNTEVAGAVTLSGLYVSGGSVLGLGMLSETEAVLSVTGTLLLDKDVVFDLSPALGGNVYIVAEAATLAGLTTEDVAQMGRDNLLFGGLAATGRVAADFVLENNTLKLELSKLTFTDLNWVGGEGATWKHQGDTAWSSATAEAMGAQPRFENGDTAIFNTAASVAVEGSVLPGGVEVNADVTFTGVEGSGASLSVAAGTAFFVSEGNTATIDASLNTTGNVQKTGAGTLLLSGKAAEIFSSMHIEEGRIAIANPESLQASFTADVSAGAALRVDVAEGVTINTLPVITGEGALEKGGAGTLAITSNMTHTGTLTITEGVMNVSGGTNSFGTLNIAGGTATFSGGATSTANGVFVENASLYITTGGQHGVIRGKLTINNGGLVELSGWDSTGWGGGVNTTNMIVINSGGRLHIKEPSSGYNQTFGGLDLILGGGTITGETASDTFDLFAADNGSGRVSTLTALGGTGEDDILVSAIQSGFNLRQNDTHIAVEAFGLLKATGVIGNGAQGNHKMIKVGAGTLWLGGENTYTGGTSIQEGKIVAASANALGTAAVEIAREGTLAFEIAGGTISNTISGEGRVIVNSAGTVTLAGANSYDGGTTIAAGRLFAGNATALGTGLVSVASGATLGRDIDVAVELNELAVADGAVLYFGSAISDTGFVVAGAADLADTIKFDFAADFSSGSYALISAGQLNIDWEALGNDNLLFGGMTSARAQASFSVENNVLMLELVKAVYSDLVWKGGAGASWEHHGATLWESASAGGSVSFENGDSVTFSMADAEVSVSGKLVVGNVTVTEDTSFTKLSGAESAVIELSPGSTFSVAEGKTAAFDKTVGSTGTIEKTGAGRLIWAADAPSMAGVTIKEGTFGLSVAENDEVAYSGVLSGMGIFEKAGAGTLTVSQANTHSGGTLVSGGTLKLTNKNGLGSGFVVVGSGATLEFAVNMDGKAHKYTLDGGTLWASVETNSGQAQIASGSGAIKLTADSTVGGTSHFGMISSGYGANELDLGGHTLTKTGENTFFLCNTTVTDGDIKIEQGRVQLINKAFFTGTTTIDVTGSGIFGLNNQDITIAAGADVTIVGVFNTPNGIYVESGAMLDMTQAYRKEDGGGSGGININGGYAKLANLKWGAGSNFGANFNTDRITIRNGGTLEVTAAQTSGSESPGFRVTEGTGRYFYSGSGTSFINAGGGAITVAENSRIIWDIANADATVKIYKAIGGAGAIEITGAGAFAMMDGNTYEGGTILSSGTLKVAHYSSLGLGGLRLVGGNLTAVDEMSSVTLRGDFEVAGAVKVSKVKFGASTWTLTGDVDTSFEGIELSSNVSFTGKATIDASGVDFTEDDADIIVFSNYTGTDASIFEAVGGTITIDSDKNVVFTAGSGFFTLVWDPAAEAATNDKLWTQTHFNGTDYSVNPDFRKYKFLATGVDETELGTIHGSVSAKDLSFAGTYAFDGVAGESAGASINFGKSLDGNGVVTGSALVSVAEGHSVSFDKTVATFGAVEKKGAGRLELAADATNVITAVDIGEGTFALSVTDESATAETDSVAYAGAITGTGTFEKTGKGELLLNGNNSGFSGNILISEGTLKMGTNKALGADNVIVTVGPGGTFDINAQIKDTNYGNFVLAGGAWINTGAEIGDGSKQITNGFSLTADSSIGGTGNFGMIASNWGGNVIQLNGNTLTKTGTNAFWLCNTTIHSGTIDVQSGRVEVRKKGLYIDGDVTFRTADSEDAVVDFGGNSITINENSSLTIDGRFDRPLGITANAGATLDLTQAYRVSDNGGSGWVHANGAGSTIKIANMTWGAGSNFGANFNSDNLFLGAGGTLEVTAAQAAETGGRIGFTILAGGGTYRYTGTGTSYVSEGEENQRINVYADGTLTWDVTGANAGLEVSKVIYGAGSVALDSTGTVTLSGANTYTGGTTVTRGTLKLGSDSALGTGTVTVGPDGVLETGFAESTVIGNVIAGTGLVSIKGDTTLSGRNTFEGKYSVTDNAVLSVTTTLGANTALAEVTAGATLRYAPGSNTTTKGIVSLAAGATLENAGADAARTAFAGTITGSGKVLQSAGILDLSAADLSAFTGSLVLADGKLTNFNYNDSVGAAKVTLSGGTMENWTVNKATGTLSVLANNAVALAGNIELAQGTLSFDVARTDAYFTGNAKVVIGDDFVFNFQNLALQDTDDPNTKTALVKVFDVSNLTLEGWDALTFEDLRIGGRELDAHYDIVIGNSGDVSITLTSQTITWTAGNSGVWDNATFNWKLNNGQGADIAFADFDTVRFANNAEVTLSGELAPTAVVVADNVALTLKGAGKVLSGTTTLGNASTLTIVADDSAVPVYKSKVSGNGSFVVDNSAEFSFSDNLNGAYTLSGSVAFTKQGDGLLKADVSQLDGFTGTVSVKAGTLEISASDALGTGTLKLDGGELILSAAAGEAVTVNNVITGAVAAGKQLTIGGEGRVVLTQANSYTGAVLVSGNAVAQNANAFGGASVSVSGSVTLDSANAEFVNAFSGSGNLAAAQSATLSGSVDVLTGTLEVRDGATLTLDSASHFGGSVKLSGASSLEKIGGATLTIAGAIESSADSAITVKDGKLAVGGDAAQSFAGQLGIEAGKSFEKVGSNTLTLTGAFSGTGTISVTAGTLRIGGTQDQSFAGSLALASGSFFEKIGAKTLTLSGKLSGNGTTQISEGTLELNTAEDYTLDSVVSGNGTLMKSGNGALTLAAGTDVASVNLAAGKLAGASLGTGGIAALTVSGAGATIDALTMSDGLLDVSEYAVTLSGTTQLSGGTISLGEPEAASLAVTGATTITDALTFNLKKLEYPTVTSPNALGETATVVYKVFDVNAGASLTGWNSSVLDKSNFTVGSGAALSDRAVVSLGDDGSVTIANTIYNMVWVGGNGVWTTGDAGSAMWTHAANPNDTAYMNSDRVTFASDATVSLGANVAPTSMTVDAGVDFTVAASDNHKITGAGTLAIGENANVVFNSAHDFTGTTTLADGASLRLNLAANNGVQFASDLTASATGTLFIDTSKLGADSETVLDAVMTGSIGNGAWIVEKLGEGTLAVDAKMNGFDADDYVNVAAGTLKLTAVDALGTAKTTIADGATLELSSETDASFGLVFTGNGNFKKSGAGTVTLTAANTMFGGEVIVEEGVLKLANAAALGDSRKSTELEIRSGSEFELAFGGSFGRELKGEGTLDFTADRLTLTADSREFTGTFALTADNAFVAATQATSFGNGTIAFKADNGEVSFELTPASGRTVADVFAGSFEGTGTVSVETGLGITMTLAGTSEDFSGVIRLKDGSKLVAEKGEAFGNDAAELALGKDAEVRIGSVADSSLEARVTGSGSLTKVGSGKLTLVNSANDFSGAVTVKDGTLRANSLVALGTASQVVLDSKSAVLELVTVAGKTATLNKLVRGSGSLSVIGGGTLNWTKSEKRFSGDLNVSENTTLNSSEFVKVDSGSVVLKDGAVWNANGGFSVEGASKVALFASSAYAMQSRASQTVASGAQVNTGSFSASANKSGSVIIEDIAITPTNGGTGALIAFDVESVADADKARITLTNDASVSLDKVAIEVTFDESVRNAWDVPEIEFVRRDGEAAKVSGDVESVTIFMADGTEVKYVYDSRTGSLSLNPISPEMNLAYAAMVAMPTEVYNQDVQSLHRRLEQRRFESANNRDEWQFFAQAQSMSVENGSDRADSATFDFSTYGALVGGDVRLSENSVFGMALAYDRGTADIHNAQGEISMDSYRATVYAGTVFNDYYFAEGGAHFGFSSYEIEREGEYGDNKGETDGWSAGLFASAGGLIPTAVKDLYLTPYVGFSYLHTAVDKVEETGTRSMEADAFNGDSLRGRVGVGASYSFAFGETPTRVGLDLAYSHEFLDDETEVEVGATGVGYSRTITEKAFPSDAVSVGASCDFTLSENTGLFLNYTVDIGVNSDMAHRANVGFRFTY